MAVPTTASTNPNDPNIPNAAPTGPAAATDEVRTATVAIAAAAHQGWPVTAKAVNTTITAAAVANEASRNETFVGPVDPAAATNAPVSAARTAPFCGASTTPNAPPTSRPATAYNTGRHIGGAPVEANHRRQPCVAAVVIAVPG